MDGKVLEYVGTARYLGVLLRIGRSFGVNLHSTKSHFYSSFNSIFHSSKKFQNEVVILHLISAYCKPYLLYATECLGLSVTQLRSIVHTWQCAISHIFHITGADVQHVCRLTSHLNCLLTFLYRIDKLSFCLVYVMLITMYWGFYLM